MNAKHTPGPWHISPLSQSGEDSTVHIDSGMVQIVDVLRRPDSTTTWANARLIAAAPELLESVRELIALLDEQLGPAINPTIIKAMQAIRKAEGEL